MKQFKQLSKQVKEHSHSNDIKTIIEEMTGYRVIEISPNRIELVEATRPHPESFMSLVEGVHPEQYGLAKWRGGIIVFSVSVNAVNDNAKTLAAKLKQTIINKFETFKNIVLKNKKLSNLIAKYNLSNDEEAFIGAFTIGNFFPGRYTGDNGKIYNETSTSIEIAGVPSEVLLALAALISAEFKQESVLVKDNNLNKYYLADKTKVQNLTKELEKLK